MWTGKRPYSNRWHLNETYVRVKGEWKYIYRAIDEQCNTIDFYLCHRRKACAAKRFLEKLIKNNPTWDMTVINTDKNLFYSQQLGN
ncbi:DDE-type integrase/transposase/recombinase (plasmid) [Legionella sp. D16C41]|uniref:DDE-type integrase/transposase/recombinase n=1 Tax=Legionella sp. D16C41 TaxID=3402688 RepID=UPI003AF9CB77